MTRQVKSKKRVSDHGEVFTNEREVNAMLDLVKQETERITSRFLEPACGEGAFLKEILRRKLEVVKKSSKKNVEAYERDSILALASLYGVDILEDNVEICRNNLFEIWNMEYTQYTKKAANDQCREIAKFILRKNILCGDALTMLQNDGTPITFVEWGPVGERSIKRRDFQLHEMLEKKEEKTSLFINGCEDVEETQEVITKPTREFKPVDYRRLNDYE